MLPRSLSPPVVPAAHERLRQDHLLLALWHSEARRAAQGARTACPACSPTSLPRPVPSLPTPSHPRPVPAQAAATAADGTVAVVGSDLLPSLGLADGPRRHEREDIAEFIAKKREIFLVQMALDTKRTEIRKLEERALQREEDIKRSEEMLEADALRFDSFLKENDEKVRTSNAHLLSRRPAAMRPPTLLQASGCRAIQRNFHTSIAETTHGAHEERGARSRQQR